MARTKGACGMTRSSGGNDRSGSVRSTDPSASTIVEEERPVRRKRRGRRAVALSILGVLILIGAAVAAGFLIVNALVGHVPRVHVGGLPASGASQTVLITGAGFGATGTTVPLSSKPQFSGLIMMLYINAGHKAGAVVSIPSLAVVPVPGVGSTKLEVALKVGGPTLLVQTVEQFTHVPINHYAQVDFNHVAKMIDAVGGVDVDILKASTSFGHKFQAGTNHLNGVTALYYVRDKSITETARILRQQNLIRAILFKLADRHLLTNPAPTVHVLSALTSMLTVDSNFTNSALMSLATQLSSLSGKAGTFLTVPAHTIGPKVFLDAQVSGQIWQAIKKDKVAAFARNNPSTVTPSVVP
jgi:polyisoprenyl-teichoic acid--peptidoglycan teichoic acid transferase